MLSLPRPTAPARRSRRTASHVAKAPHGPPARARSAATRSITALASAITARSARSPSVIAVPGPGPSRAPGLLERGERSRPPDLADDPLDQRAVGLGGFAS